MSHTRTEPESDLIALLTQDGVALRRSGPDKYWAKCPFHQERTASFQVRISPRGYWNFKCWSQYCGLRGSARDYRRHTNRPPAENPDSPVQAATPEVLYDPLTPEILTIAANHYNQQLLQHQEAVDYLLARGINPEQAQRWGVGYAPGASLYRLLAQQMSQQQLERCALLRYSRREDRLSRRIIIPSYRPDGVSDWHTGRAIDPDNERPYMSVPGSRPPLLRLRDTPDPAIILVEGPFDLLAVLTAGFHGAATAGNPHIPRLRQAVRRRYRQVLLLPDRDPAGEKWANYIAEAFRTGRDNDPVIRVLRLPEYCADPGDALIQRQHYTTRATIATAIRTAYTSRDPPADEQPKTNPSESEPTSASRSTTMAYNNGPLIQFFGHLAADPQEFGNSDDPPVGFSVAVNYQRYSSQEREYVEMTDFYRCTAFRFNAKQAYKLRKGDFIWVSGSFQPREYEARDGTNRTSYDVAVLDLHAFLALTKRDNGNDDQDNDDDDNRRRGNGNSRGRSQGRNQGRGRSRDDDDNRGRGGGGGGGNSRGRSQSRNNNDDDDDRERGRGGSGGGGGGNSRGRSQGRGRNDNPPRGQDEDVDMDVDDLPF